VTCIPEVVARGEVKYRRAWRAMLRSGRPDELAAFRLAYDQPAIPPGLLERAYHAAVHRAAELHESEKEASRAWLREHGEPEEDLAWCTAWPPTA
jgi:hypothetical protein